MLSKLTGAAPACTDPIGDHVVGPIARLDRGLVGTVAGMTGEDVDDRLAGNDFVDLATLSPGVVGGRDASSFAATTPRYGKVVAATIGT